MSSESETGLAPVAGGSDRKQAAMPFILVAVLIDMMSIGIIVPVLPMWVGSFTASPAEQAYWLGVVSFTFGLASFFASPMLGALSDQYGRRPVLLLGFLGLAITFFATAAATALWMLIAVRLLGGGMQSNASVAQAYVADIRDKDNRAKRFGMLGAMFGLGFILGPALGGLLGGFDLRLPFVVAGILALINLVYGYRVLPESLPLDRRRPFSWRSANPFSAFVALASHRGIGALVAVLACAGLAQGLLYNSWVLFTHFKFGWGAQENGASLAAVGVMSVIVQGWLLGKLLKRFPARRLAVMGLLSSSLAYGLWGASASGTMMVAVIFANVLGFTVNASIQSIVSGAVDGKSQGQTLGATSSINSLTAVIAPVISAPMLMAVSGFPQGDWRIGAPMYLGSALLALGLLFAWLHFRHHAAAESSSD